MLTLMVGAVARRRCGVEHPKWKEPVEQGSAHDVLGLRVLLGEKVVRLVPRDLQVVSGVHLAVLVARASMFDTAPRVPCYCLVWRYGADVLREKELEVLGVQVTVCHDERVFSRFPLAVPVDVVVLGI